MDETNLAMAALTAAALRMTPPQCGATRILERCPIIKSLRAKPPVPDTIISQPRPGLIVLRTARRR